MTHRLGMVIVGASMTGAFAAKSLRGAGYDGPITMIGSEPHLPYERPPLSKGYLQGSADLASLFVHPADWYAEHDVDLHLGESVTAIDRGDRTVTLAGERIPYRKLLLATGASPRRLRVRGAELPGVHTLRTLEDSDDLRAAFSTAKCAVFIGGGWIGLETAAAARQAGLDVTVIEAAELPLMGVLGRDVATSFADLHRSHGVELLTNATLKEISSDKGRASGVVLSDGRHIPADVVVVGIGAVPNDSLAVEAGLPTDNGVLVDEFLRTPDPDVFAAGDVANAWHPVFNQRVRVEHWANARKQGTRVAQSMLGFELPYSEIPYFFTDQYDLGMEYTGFIDSAGFDEAVVRGDRASGKYMVFWVRDAAVLAGMAVNIWDQVGAIADLVRLGRPVDLDLLRDPDTALSELSK